MNLHVYNWLRAIGKRDRIKKPCKKQGLIKFAYELMHSG